MKMTLREMKAVLPHDVLKYIGPSSGGLLRNKLYTVKDSSEHHLGFFMPKGQSINVDKNDHALWEMHEAKGAMMAKERQIQSLTVTFNSYMTSLTSFVEDVNMTAEDLDLLLKEFPLDSKMKLLGKLTKDQMELLDFFHKINRTRLTVPRLLKAFKKDQ